MEVEKWKINDSSQSNKKKAKKDRQQRGQKALSGKAGSSTFKLSTAKAPIDNDLPNISPHR